MPRSIEIPYAESSNQSSSPEQASNSQLNFPLDPVSLSTLKTQLFIDSKEIFIPAEAMNPTTSTGCSSLTKVESAVNKVDYWVLDFDTTTSESAFLTIRMPEDWNADGVFFEIVWTTASGLATETVVWGVKGRCYSDDDAVDQAYGTEVNITDTFLAQGDIHITQDSDPVTLSGNLIPGNWCQFRISRKTASDNLTGDARLIGVRIKYRTI